MLRPYLSVRLRYDRAIIFVERGFEQENRRDAARRIRDVSYFVRVT